MAAYMENILDSQNKIVKMQNVVLIGGTFDTLHKGHKEYIKRAFEKADKVFIQLSSDNYAASLGKKYKVKSYYQRATKLRSYIFKNFNKDFRIVKLNSLQELENFCIQNDEINTVLAINEYLELFEKYNELRIKNNKPKLNILEMEIIKNKNGEKISSTKINGNGKNTPN